MLGPWLELGTLSAAGLATAIPLGGFIFGALSCLSRVARARAPGCAQ
jgi:hypothetical protein